MEIRFNQWKKLPSSIVLHGTIKLYLKIQIVKKSWGNLKTLPLFLQTNKSLPRRKHNLCPLYGELNPQIGDEIEELKKLPCDLFSDGSNRSWNRNRRNKKFLITTSGKYSDEI